MKYLPILLFFLVIFWFFYEKKIDINENKNKIEISNEIKKEILKQEKTKNILKQWNGVVNANNKIDNKSEIITKTNNTEINSQVKPKNYDINSEINIDKLKYSSNTNNIIKIGWKRLEEIEYIIIWKNSYKTQLIDWFLYVLIEENNYLDWDYIVIFQNKNWSIFQYNKIITFTLNKNNLVVTDITPKVLKNNIERNIILQWKWFSKVISIQLSNNIVLKSTSFNVINNNVMVIKIPKNMSIWNYSLNIMNTEWIFTPDIKINVNN